MIMDYKEKYEQALEGAKKIIEYYKEHHRCDETSIEDLESIFPELKESEDEMIRKDIIILVKDWWDRVNKNTIFTKEQMLAWLEKQVSPQMVADAYLRGCNDTEKKWLEKQGASVDVDSILNKVGIKPAHKDGNAWCILYGYNLQEGICGFGDTKAEALVEFIKELLEKQKDKDKTIEELGKYKDAYTQEVLIPQLEKQGEQKPADNVEPKFKVGDWITDGEAVFHITSYSIDYGYQLETPKGTSFHFSNETVEKKYHLWTIQDAKESDVLADVYGNIGIIQEYDDFDWRSYCSLGCNGGFQGFNVEHENDKTHPATKEQCDLLFQKMKEEGYEWDANKKELMKIERKPTWSEEDEHRAKDTIYFLDTAKKHYASTVELDACIDWIKSLKKRMEKEVVV